MMYQRASMLTTGVCVSSKSKRRKKRTRRHEGVIEKEEECVKQCVNDRDICTKKEEEFEESLKAQNSKGFESLTWAWLCLK